MPGVALGYCATFRAEPGDVTPIQEQKLLVRGYCLGAGLELLETACDEGAFAARSLGLREGGARVLRWITDPASHSRLASTGPARSLVIPDLSRMVHGLGELEPILDWLEEAGVTLHLADSELVIPPGEDSFLHWIEEALLLEEVLRRSRKPPHGIPPRRPAYGYRWQEGKGAVPAIGEMRTVGRIWELASEGIGPTETARRLPKEKRAARRGKWTAPKVSRILKRLREDEDFRRTATDYYLRTRTDQRPS